MDIKIDEQPKGWLKTTIENICIDPQYGYTTKAVEKGDIKLLRTTDITSGKINWDKVPFCLKNPDEPEKYLLAEGDIVISRAGSVGVSYLIAEPEKAVFASYLIRFRPLINKTFFKFFLESPFYWSEISEKKLGIAVQNVNATKLKSIKLTIPPLPEQNQIVSKIEELFSELDNGIENLKKAREQLKTYRQAVLKYAFEGKLTKEWRTRQKEMGNPPESAEKLLERIKAEREKHYQRQLEDWKKACGQAKTEGKKSPPKPKKPRELPPLTEKELAELPKLPEGWGWYRLDEVCKSVQKVKAEQQNQEGEFIYIDIGCIDNKMNKIQEFKTYKWKDAPSRAQQIIKENDILFSTVRTYLRNIAIVDKELFESQIGSTGFTVIRPNISIINSYFVFYYCISEQFIQPLNELQTGSSYPAVRDADVFGQFIPVCSIKEQIVIFQEIESRLSVCDQLEKTIEDSLKKAEALRQSILKKAFEGELTKEWREEHPELVSGENSVENLLERIKAEKSLTAGRGKVQSKKMKNK